jgi:hypothetical protein
MKEHLLCLTGLNYIAWCCPGKPSSKLSCTCGRVFAWRRLRPPSGSIRFFSCFLPPSRRETRVTGVGCVLAGAHHIHVSVVPGPDSSPHERQNADQVDAQLWSLSSALSQYTSRSRSGVLTPRHFVDARHGHHRRLNTSRAV